MQRWLSSSTSVGGGPMRASCFRPHACCLYDTITTYTIMAPAYANAVCYLPTKLPQPMEYPDKPSWSGDEQDCFPCIEPMLIAWRSSHHPMNTLLRRTRANIKKHANHTEGVQYATTSFVCGRRGLQACGENPATSAKSRKRGFQCTTSSASRHRTTLLRLS